MMVIPIYDTVLLPGVPYHFNLDTINQEELNELKSEDSPEILLLPLKDKKEREEIQAEDFYEIGVRAQVLKVQENAAGIWLSVQAVERARCVFLRVLSDRVEGEFESIPEEIDVNETGRRDLVEFIKRTAGELAEFFHGAEKLAEYMNTLTEANELISFLSQFIGMSPDEKYALLETSSYKDRGSLFCSSLVRFKNAVELKVELTQKYNETKGKSYQEAAIRQQMEVLQKKLEELSPEERSETEEYRRKIEEAGMPEDAKKEILRTLKRLEQEGPHGSEYNTLHGYMEFVTDLPWKKTQASPIDLKKAREILDRGHYGLDKVKERILQHMAVMALKKNQTGSILLLVGAPGTGKTSIGKGIAEALGRKYTRISFGGVRDEAEIRGHRRTYVGAMPGRIMEGIRRAGVSNPVMVLDEIDKLISSYNGDPASALLEVLDPEQNNTFTDHYLNVPYDLTQVLFVCTANTMDTIPQPLLDRMEVISLSGYTPDEKFYIARDYLIPASIRENGLEESDLTVSEETIRTIIADYTMEAGVRGLKKQMDVLCRKAAVQIVEEGRHGVYVKPGQLPDLLGKRVANHEKVTGENPAGVVTGLAWTQAGGEILFIESVAMEGSGQIRLTGQLGDVMKESASISLSLVKSLFAGNGFLFAKSDIHIHVPSGAVPKDGPSAGITLFTALVSLVTGRTVDPRLAMTGEISLRGKVLPIGGLPEKLMAAERAGIKTVLIPKENEVNLKDVPKETKAALEILPVNTVEEVMAYAFGPKFLEEQKEERERLIRAV